MLSLFSLRRVLILAVTAAIAAIALAGTASAAETPWGELGRFNGKGRSGGGAAFETAYEIHGFGVDQEDGSVYVADEKTEEAVRIQKYSAAGDFLGSAVFKPEIKLPAQDREVSEIEGIAVDHKNNVIYALATYTREYADKLDPTAEVAGALYAFDATPVGGKLEPAAGTDKGLLGSAELLHGNSETPGQPLLEPTGLTVNPKTGEVLILGQKEVGESDDAAIEQVSSSGVLVGTYVAPAAIEAVPNSPVATPGGRVLYEEGPALELAPANLAAGAPTTVFQFKEPEGFKSETFNEELLTLELGESQGGMLALTPEKGTTKGTLVALTETNATHEGTVVANWSGTRFSYSEEGGTVKVAELGWTGGGEGELGKANSCVIGFGGETYPLISGFINEKDEQKLFVLASSTNEVVEFGPNGKSCPTALGAGSVEARIQGSPVTKVTTTQKATLLARVKGANVLSTEWKFGDGTEAPVVTPVGRQTQTAETTHQFTSAGVKKIEAIIHTDDLATPTVTVTGTITVTEAQTGAPVVIEQPKSVATVEGETATFTARASGEPAPTVQWEVFDEGKWTTISGATSTTLTVSATTTAENERGYRATFENGKEPAAKTNVATLSVESKAAHQAKLEAEAAARKKQEEEEAAAAAKKHEEELAAQNEVLNNKESLGKATIAGASISVSSSGTLTIKVSCLKGPVSCAGTITLKTSSAVAASKGAMKKILTLATGSFSVKGGTSKSVTLHLNGTARKLLAKLHVLRVRSTVLAHNAHNESSTTVQSLTLRPAKKKK
jgi:PKD repeat protein